MFAACAIPRPSEAGPAPARPPRDRIHVSGHGEDFAPGGRGAGVGLGWLHSFSDRLSTDVSARWERADGTRLSYGRLQGFAWLHPRLHIRGGASFGRGVLGGEALSFRRLEVAPGAMLVPSRLFVELESQHLVLGETRGHVLTPALVGFPVSWLGVRLAYHVSTSAGLDVQALSVRGDLHREPLSPFAGMLLGRAASVAVVPGSTSAAPVTSQVFAGIRVSVGRGDLTLYAERIRSDGQTRARLSLVWVIAL
jgi:hypothetical protein